MKRWKPILLMITAASLSCEDSTAPRRMKIKNPHVRFVEVHVEACNYISVECAYTIGGVTVTGGGSNNPPPLIIWTVSTGDPPSVFDFLPYPTDGDYRGYAGATVHTSDQYVPWGGTIVEQSCDPRGFIDPDCIRPLQPRDSVFLGKLLTDMSSLTDYFTSDDMMESQEMIDQCRDMRVALQNIIANKTFNRPAGNTTQGIFRGRDVSGESTNNQNAVHAGMIVGGQIHVDDHKWDIYAADSMRTGRSLAGVLLHEAAHSLQKNHGPQGQENYAAYPYFKYLLPSPIPGRSCVQP